MNSGNYYKDACLVAAGGRATGVLDFYQVHTYDGAYGYNPFNVILKLILEKFLLEIYYTISMNYISRPIHLIMV